MEKVTALFIHGLRLGFVIAAFLVYLYVYNCARGGMSWASLFQPLMLFWLAMVALGWIGVFADPSASIPVIVLVVTPFYGYTAMNLSVMFFGIGLAMAAVDGPVNRAPLSAAQGASVSDAGWRARPRGVRNVRLWAHRAGTRPRWDRARSPSSTR
ncbi:hypothetical protein AB0M36_15990 [Actinoplanes sp. NPDC051346]|uniref:hypothetical protein n=1 Tax=Actinoplanes sp. NPDC051346 TaxID=3155048 RepID=UPI003426CA47